MGLDPLDGLDEEIQQHLERETEDNIARGMTPAEARQAARKKFGNITRVREDARAVWVHVWLEQTLLDTRYALRGLRRNPGFTAVVIATLALGIGMTTAMFSVVNAALLRPLAYPDADRLIWITDYDYLIEQRDNYVTRSTYLQWREQAQSYSGMTAYGNRDLAMIAQGEASQERIAAVAGEFWEMTGAAPVKGRLFGPQETHVIVLSHRLLERRFGGDLAAVGKTVEINGSELTVIGVLPSDFEFLFPLQFVNGDEIREIDGYVPFPDEAMRLPDSASRDWDALTRALGPSTYNVRVVGKLKPGVSVDEARAEMETVYQRVAMHYPAFRLRHTRLHFDTLKEKLVGDSRRALFVLMAGVGFVLLIACANTANLLLARGSTRHREMAIRAASGAGRWRMIRQLLIESIVMASIGGVAGVFAAHGAVTLMLRVASASIPRLTEATIDGRVLVFTTALSLATGVLFGLGPAAAAGKIDLSAVLKSGGGIVPRGAGRLNLRRALAAAEVALALVLLCGAGLMLKSFQRMNAGLLGFSPEKILALRVPLSGPQFVEWPAQSAYINELLGRVSSAPGVEAAGIETTTYNISIEAGGTTEFAAVRMVSPGYLRVIGTPLVRGQWPTQEETLDAVLVNESFARSLGPAVDPTGLPIRGAFLSGTIAGVVRDFKSRQLDAEPLPEIYYPYQRSPTIHSVKLLVRTTGDANAMAPQIRELVSKIDLTQPAYEIQTLERALSDSIAPRRFNTILLGVFAGAALLMALIGIYGVVAYAVARRTQEIGIRMALGAARGDILRLVIGYGGSVAFLGIAAGLGAALALTRLMGSLLYDVKPHDPQVFVVVAFLLAGVVALACWLPAMRAGSVEPTIALRDQ